MELQTHPELANAVRPLTTAERAVLKASIQRGWLETLPVIIDEEGYIIDGHHRVAIAAELGLTDYPVKVQAGLSWGDKVDTAKRLNIARRQVGRQEWEEQVAELDAYAAKRYEEGASKRAIAKELGVAHSTVVRGVSTGAPAPVDKPKAAVPMGTPPTEDAREEETTMPAVAVVPKRTTGMDGKSRPAARRTPAERDALRREIKKRIDGGADQRTVAKELGIAQSAVSGYWKEATGQKAVRSLSPKGKKMTPEQEERRWTIGPGGSVPVLEDEVLGAANLFMAYWKPLMEIVNKHAAGKLMRAMKPENRQKVQEDAHAMRAFLVKVGRMSSGNGSESGLRIVGGQE